MALSTVSSTRWKGRTGIPALQGRLLAAFSGREVLVGDIEKFVLVHTAFRESHYKGILRTLEKNSKLKVVRAPPNRKTGTFGDPGIVVRFD